MNSNTLGVNNTSAVSELCVIASHTPWAFSLTVSFCSLGLLESVSKSGIHNDCAVFFEQCICLYLPYTDLVPWHGSTGGLHLSDLFTTMLVCPSGKKKVTTPLTGLSFGKLWSFLVWFDGDPTPLACNIVVMCQRVGV